MRPIRRADIVWADEEVETYEKLKRKTNRLQQNIPGYVKEIIAQHLGSEASEE